MKPGAKPKPSKLKMIHGSREPINEREPRFDATQPEAPDFLCKDGAAEWERICEMLHRAGVMTAVDRGALAAYCQAYGRWAQAERALAVVAERDGVGAGLVIKTKGGNMIQNPLVGVANRALELMLKAAVEFGMTPSSRTRVVAGGDPNEQTNPFAQYGRLAG